MKYYTLLNCFLWLLLMGNAQSGQDKKTLSLGDTLPNLKLDYLQPANECKQTGDYRGRRLILDFWNTRCMSCIAAFPKLERLQAEYKDRLVVLPVTTQSPGHIDSFRKRNKILENTKLPLVVGAAALASVFPHTMEPHLIWLDENLKVQAITEGSYLTAESIDKWLSGTALNLPLKKDILDYDPGLPLFISGNGGGEDAFGMRSIVGPFMEGLPSRAGFFSYKTGTRVTAVNTPVLDLLWLAYPQLLSTPAKNIIYEFPPGSFYLKEQLNNKTLSEDQELSKVNYELLVPTTDKEIIRKLVAKDLEAIFGITGQTAIRKRAGTEVKVFVLRQTTDKPPGYAFLKTH